jgi:outer membrane immunogenic protein
MSIAAAAILPMLAAVSATAADLPVTAPTYRAQPPVLYSWTGLYVGGHLGAGWSTSEWRVFDTFGAPTVGLGSGSASGFLGGAQIGINYQVDAIVFGIEGDFSWANVSGQTCDAITGLLQCNSKADRFATLVGRFGIAADRALVYVKGGAAWVHNTYGITLISSPNVFEPTSSLNKWGWTAGAGVEYALVRNWMVKLEYDFMDFGTSRVVFDVPQSATTIPMDIKQRVHALKVGWNYKFDWGAPVAARY